MHVHVYLLICALLTRKSCAVEIRNAILKNHLNEMHTANRYKYFGSKIERKVYRVYIRYIKTLIKQICFFFIKYNKRPSSIVFFMRSLARAHSCNPPALVSTTFAVVGYETLIRLYILK